MSDRLTTPAPSSSPRSHDLALPALLLLVAAWAHARPSAAPDAPPVLFPGLLVLLALQCGAVVRGMLPAKAPAVHRTLAVCLGAASVTLLPSEMAPVPLTAWILALAGWNFLHAPEMPPRSSRLLSGLCAGAALCLEPVTLCVAGPMFVMNSLRLARGGRAKRLVGVWWYAGLPAGLIPLFLGVRPWPDWRLELLRPPLWIGSLLESPGLLPPATWPFLLLGLGVAAFQARTTLAGLILPLFLGLPLLGLLSPAPELSDAFALSLLWPVAYGGFRVARGVEQGVRTPSPVAAKKVMPAILILLLAAVAAATLIAWRG